MRSLARRLGKAQARRVAGIANFIDRPIDISDHYTEHLTYAIAGMLTRGNLWCFDHALRNLPSDAPIVEVGSFCGLSTNVLAYYKRKIGLKHKLITCDCWSFDAAMKGDVPVTRDDYARFVKESFMRSVQAFSSFDMPQPVEMTSDDFFQAWREGRTVTDVFGKEVRLGGPISFCYIDGNHSYEVGRRDWVNADEFLEPGGFVLFDDTWDGCGWGVSDAMPEVEASPKYELIAKNPNYFFRKRRS